VFRTRYCGLVSVGAAVYHDGVFLEFFGGCGVDEDPPSPSVKGEYGAVMACGGALEPDFVRGGSAEPGHFFCSSCILSSGSPTM
jgi:hypothetical protein